MNTVDNKRVTKNAIILYIRMIITLCVTIYTSRVILEVLGVVDFGVYNVVSGATSIIVFFTGSLSNVSQRYLNIGLGKKDYDETNNCFNQFILIFSIIAIAVFLIGEVLCKWCIEDFLVIPSDRITAAYYVFHFSLLSLVFSLLQVPFQSAIIAHERMGIYAYTSLFECFSKLGILYLIAASGFDRLIHYSFWLMAIVGVLFAFNVIYSFTKFEELRFKFYYSKTLMKEMVTFVGYNVFGCFAYAGSQQGVNILLNIFFGPAVNAARAIAIQVSNAIYRFSDSILVAVKPPIMKQYAQGNISEMVQIAVNASRYCLYICLIIAIPILFSIDFILDLWLKEVPDYTAVFVILIVIEGFVNLLCQPISILVNATGKLKRNQFYGRIYTLIVLPIAYLTLLWIKEPAVPLLCSLLGTSLYFINNVYDIQLQLQYKVADYFKQIIIPVVLYFIPVLIACYFAGTFIENKFVSFIAVGFTDVILGGFVVMRFLLSTAERMYIVNMVKSKIIKK